MKGLEQLSSFWICKLDDLPALERDVRLFGQMSNSVHMPLGESYAYMYTSSKCQSDKYQISVVAQIASFPHLFEEKIHLDCIQRLAQKT